MFQIRWGIVSEKLPPSWGNDSEKSQRGGAGGRGGGGGWHGGGGGRHGGGGHWHGGSRHWRGHGHWHGGWWGGGIFIGGLGWPYGYPYPYVGYPYRYPHTVYGAEVVTPSAPTYYEQQPIQREVVYPNGKYVLYGDGVTQAWQWVWIPATLPSPSEPR